MARPPVDPRSAIRAVSDRTGHSFREMSIMLGRRAGAVGDFVRTGSPALGDRELWLIADYCGVPPAAVSVTADAGPRQPVHAARARRSGPAWPPPPPID